MINHAGISSSTGWHKVTYHNRIGLWAIYHRFRWWNHTEKIHGWFKQYCVVNVFLLSSTYIWQRADRKESSGLNRWSPQMKLLIAILRTPCQRDLKLHYTNYSCDPETSPHSEASLKMSTFVVKSYLDIGRIQDISVNSNANCFLYIISTSLHSKWMGLKCLLYILRQRSRSLSAHVMACRMAEPSHHLNPRVISY